MHVGWYLMRKERGNIYLDIDVTTGSEVSGIRGGTATPTCTSKRTRSLRILGHTKK